MKTYILVITALLALSPAAAAMDVQGGLKTGLNVSTFVGSDADGAGQNKISRAGLVAGGYLIFPVRTLPFRIQAEALISQKGATYKWGVLGTAYETRYRLTYLEIPILARFDFENRIGAHPSLLIGPSIGIKLSARGESRTIGSASSGNIDNIRGIDPGIAVGGLVEMETSRGFITVECRYTLSLATISDNDNGSDSDLKNSTGSIILGYRF